MAAGDKPTHRIITKPEGETKWKELAAIWERDGKQSVTFKEPVAPGTKAIIVKNDTKPANG